MAAAAKLGRFASLSVIIPEDTLEPTSEEVKAEVLNLELRTANQFIFQFDHEAGSSKEFFKARYPDQKVTYTTIQEGASNATVVKIDGTAKYVLKKTTLPPQVFDEISHWKGVSQILKYAKGASLSEKVKDLFFKNPGQVLPQTFPHVNYGQREKLASIVGSQLKIVVPESSTLYTPEGLYTIHTYIPNAGSALAFDVAKVENQAKVSLQSLQDIGILDILLENQDRNPGNILVIPRIVIPEGGRGPSREVLDLIPVDHALTLQHSNFWASMAFSHHQDPCWRTWSKANAPLTSTTIEKIKMLDANVLLKSLEEGGLIVDDKIASSITKNIAILQKGVQINPEMTLNELYTFYKDELKVDSRAAETISF
ncbi:MAG: hypothetical protein KDK59_04655 [Simkania sp.]|nr:hypothetical protein [Simkania sp.]